MCTRDRSTSSSPLVRLGMPAHRYAGVPSRAQRKPSVPRAVRRENAAANKEGKENVAIQAQEAYAQYHHKITEISIETGLPRSTVALAANNKGGREVVSREANAKNAWMKLHMKEVNEEGT
jgi:hypothetical protein